MHGADHRERDVDVGGDLGLLLVREREHDRDGRLAFGVQRLPEVGVAPVLRGGVQPVLQLRAVACFLDPRDHGLVALPVVHDGVALAPVDQRFHVRRRLAGYADERVCGCW